MGPYHEALLQCGQRYAAMIEQHVQTPEPLHDFIVEFIAGCQSELPVAKLCRWLGYIQGVLIERQITSVQAERDWTRPLFRPLDFAQGGSGRVPSDVERSAALLKELDEWVEKCRETAVAFATASTRIAQLETALRWYQEQMCEGFCRDLPRAGTYSADMDDRCSGCKARATLNGEAK